MRKGIYIIGAMLVALLLLGESCGGGRSPAKQTIAAPIPTVKMPEGLSTEIEGSIWELNGISNEATGIETSPGGTIDSEADNQLLITKNYPK